MLFYLFFVNRRSTHEIPICSLHTDLGYASQRHARMDGSVHVRGGRVLPVHDRSAGDRACVLVGWTLSVAIGVCSAGDVIARAEVKA